MLFLSKNTLTTAAVAIASVACAAYAPAQTVSFNSAGSSAQWQTYALAAAQLANKGAGYTVHRYTVKGKAADGFGYAAITDSRTSGGKTVPAEVGNLWVVWNQNSSGTPVNIWAFTSVDSVVGLRSFFAVPRAKLVLDSAITTTTAGGQLISATLPGWGTEDKALPTSVYNALTNLPLTAANTDIRPEDGLFAYNRIVATLNTTTRSGLGYGPGPIGTPIASHYSTSVATPVAFSLTGADPISGQTHPSGGFTTIPVGAAPIVFIVNKTNTSTGLGKSGIGHDLSVTGSAGNVAYSIFGGKSCIFSGVAVNPVLREPLSGTMNTAEFTNFRLGGGNGSQEANINPTAANNNPLNLTCLNGAGVRTRAIGTGESINNGVLPTADAIGYAFFGYGNFSKIAASASYGYLTLDGVDPINTNYTTGQLPACAASGCPHSGGASFVNLRKGKYRSWSLLRVVTDSVNANPTNYNNTIALTKAANKLINNTVPDFVPFLASCTVSGPNEPGLDVYRSHYTQGGVSPVNGSVPSTISCSAHSGQGAQTLVGKTFGGGAEAGGDVGGAIEGPFTTSPVQPGVLNARQ